jgi:hypothetical protein
VYAGGTTSVIEFQDFEDVVTFPPAL